MPHASRSLASILIVAFALAALFMVLFPPPPFFMRDANYAHSAGFTPQLPKCFDAVGKDTIINDIWEDAQCLSAEPSPEDGGERYARFYAFNIEESADVVVSLSSRWDSFLYLRAGIDRAGDILAANDDYATLIDNAKLCSPAPPRTNV